MVLEKPREGRKDFFGGGVVEFLGFNQWGQTPWKIENTLRELINDTRKPKQHVAQNLNVQIGALQCLERLLCIVLTCQQTLMF